MTDDQIIPRDIVDPIVLQAMRRVPRHEFVPSEYLDQSYANHPLPIGYGQTISQPFIVAYMSENLELKAGDRVLEIGTGSGYQAAILADMGMEVYSIEIVPELAAEAEARLKRLGYAVQVRAGDGYYGWPEAAPFEAIIVTAAHEHVPPPLIEQLRPGGRLIIPLGPVGAIQTLWQFTPEAGHHLQSLNLGEVRFVPFTRSAPRP
ncbi:Protein-L-isoaspartate O-methyltransferase [Thermoflexales bacterium]|nr:Protein-L-isoaspartate O-methyltransferase [Thermoflexales bacterium]